MSTAEDFLAQADAATAQLAEATTEAERMRLRRASGVYRRLAANVGERAEREGARAPAKIPAERKYGTGMFKK
jgi:hypothetical protein